MAGGFRRVNRYEFGGLTGERECRGGAEGRRERVRVARREKERDEKRQIPGREERDRQRQKKKERKRDGGKIGGESEGEKNGKKGKKKLSLSSRAHSALSVSLFCTLPHTISPSKACSGVTRCLLGIRSIPL